MPRHAKLLGKTPAPTSRAARAVETTPPTRVDARPLVSPGGTAAPSGTGGAENVQTLQRLAGNQAVMRMLDIQRAAGDLRKPSDEAIRAAAAEGGRTPSTPLPYLDRIQASFGRHSISDIQAHVGPAAARASRAMSAQAYATHVVFGARPDLRTAAHEAAHVVQQRAGVQLAGGIGRVGDPYERHADAVADAVAGRAGRPLEAPVRAQMESSFGADFSSVRVHEGPSARAVGAVAYAQGEDLHFQPGRYDPGSQTGRKLIGHELTHVVQQRAGRVATPQGKGGPGINSDTALEREADDLGARAAAGESVRVSGQASGPAAAASGGPMQLNTDSALEYLAPLLAKGITGGDELTTEEETACEEAGNGALDLLAVETPEALLVVRVMDELHAKLQRLMDSFKDKYPLIPWGRRLAGLSKFAGTWRQEAQKTRDRTDKADVVEWADKAKNAAGNKLYIGGGKEIDAKLASKPSKKAGKQSRILAVDDDKWTWFVNAAWMEAGMEKDFRFKLTTQLTDEIKQVLVAGNVTGDQFLAAVGSKIASKGDPHPLWHSGDLRATYFAHEIAMLLDAGYLFEEVDRANSAGKKQQFRKKT